jgi:inhibitor of cysteine peptidase
LSSTTITKADAGKTITVSPGGTITISLDENPTTGFRWELEPANDAALELLSSEYIAPGAGVGGGGRRLWTFKARRSGEVRLVLKRRRVWQKDDSDGERFEVTIGVTT